MIDDSAFERAEVELALPQVRVYSEKAIYDLLQLPAFDVLQSTASGERRTQYRINIERQQAQHAFTDDYDEFLRSCEMRLQIFVPATQSDIERCYELINRSNQQNLSGRRYSMEEFKDLLTVQGVLCAAIQCADRFGDYGIIGYLSMDERPEIPVVFDFVLSCRVVQKRIEHAIFQWLADHAIAKGRQHLSALFVPTAKNAVLAQFFEQTPFKRSEEATGHMRIEWDLARRLVERQIMDVPNSI